MNGANHMSSPSPIQQIKIFYRVETKIDGKWYSHEVELAQPPQFGPGGAGAPVVNIRPPASRPTLASKPSLPKPREEGPRVGRDPGDYVIQIGKKYKGMRLVDCGIHDVVGYGEWIKSDHAEKRKVLTGKWLEAFNAIEAYAKSREFVRKPGGPRP